MTDIVLNIIHQTKLHFTFQDLYSIGKDKLCINYAIIGVGSVSHMVQLLYVVTVNGAKSSHEVFSKSNGSDFPVLQWLRLHLPRQRVQVQSLVKELRFHMPVSKKKKNHKTESIL